MSNVNIVIVDKGNITFTQLSYRFLMFLLQKNPNILKSIKGYCPIKRYLDQGYVVFDFNDMVIINNQMAFSFKSNLDKETAEKLKAQFYMLDCVV